MQSGTISRIPGFYKLSLSERQAALGAWLDGASAAALTGAEPLSAEAVDRMIENAIGTFALPLGLALNFLVNGRDIVVPMAVEEPSVIAGASNAARLVRLGGGFTASADRPLMVGQIQVLDIPAGRLDEAAETVLAGKAALLDSLAGLHPTIEVLGGGALDLEVRALPETPAGPFLVVELQYDVRDAMGANAVNTACERLAPEIERLTGGRVHLRILSNLTDKRKARARCKVQGAALAFKDYSGEEVAQGIVEAWAFAAVDPHRAATHNKGIMNGIDPVLIATGNDWRAVEAGAHAHAARSGRYTSLSTWKIEANGDLSGELEMPLAVGIVGGATRVHPAARAALQLMGIQSAAELAEIAVSAGLASNLAALRALATEGIQRGHMRLHNRK